MEILGQSRALHSIGLGVGWRNTVTIYLLNVQCLWQTVIIIASLMPNQLSLFNTIILMGVGHFIFEVPNRFLKPLLRNIPVLFVLTFAAQGKVYFPNFAFWLPQLDCFAPWNSLQILKNLTVKITVFLFYFVKLITWICASPTKQSSKLHVQYWHVQYFGDIIPGKKKLACVV